MSEEMIVIPADKFADVFCGILNATREDYEYGHYRREFVDELAMHMEYVKGVFYDLQRAAILRSSYADVFFEAAAKKHDAAYAAYCKQHPIKD